MNFKLDFITCFLFVFIVIVNVNAYFFFAVISLILSCAN
jgi:hypothetical protein